MRKLIVSALTFAALVPGASARAEVPACATGVLASPEAGAAAFATCRSDALGGETTFAYYVPPSCAASRCPVLYLLHGFGGDRSSMLRPGGTPTAWQRALSQDPVTGADLPDLPLIVVAPEGRTVATSLPGAPPPGLESFWVDWNPRYWQNPPRFEGFVIDELIGIVDRSFPTIANREGRAIDGVSLGGFGSFKLGLQHPDVFASAGSMSGALNILVAPAVQPIGPGDPGAGGWPIWHSYIRAPRTAQTPSGFPFGDPFGAFGDPVADEAYFRGNNPLDLSLNGTGLPLRFVHNDTVPQPSDLGNPPSYVGAQALESVVFPMNVEMRAALTQHGNSDFVHEIHPGLHSGRYWDPHIRAQLEYHFSRVSHPGEPALAPATPASFDFRSIRDRFSVWGWSVETEDREPEGFVTLWDASKSGVSVVASGTVTITTPPLNAAYVSVQGAPTGVWHVEFLPDGRARIGVLWQPTPPTDEHLASSGIPRGEHTIRICLGYAPNECPDAEVDN